MGRGSGRGRWARTRAMAVVARNVGLLQIFTGFAYVQEWAYGEIWWMLRIARFFVYHSYFVEMFFSLSLLGWMLSRIVELFELISCECIVQFGLRLFIFWHLRIITIRIDDW
ncbi:hypothetical protein IFM89_003815 [Coptis chinensis]|uniref:Uncharacterized protein n=1 Tax=Coptis chinensis TaxID=261450 RepID=A0A835LUN0_9MAGN|nr:hypothetical protein IFM89_003815 [Coptis chinensis]